MLKLRFIILLLILFGISPNLNAEQYVYISEEGLAKYLRVNVGITQMTMNPTGRESRNATGLHLLNEFKIFSNTNSPERKFSIIDGGYFQMDFARMNSTPYIDSRETESRFSLNTTFGYYAWLGYKTDKYSAYLGTDFRWSRMQVGETAIPELNGPLFRYYNPIGIRAEYSFSDNEPFPRICLSIWNTLNIKNPSVYRSVIAEYSINKSGSWWLMAQANFQSALGDNTFKFSGAVQTNYTQFIVGVRKGLYP